MTTTLPKFELAMPRPDKMDMFVLPDELIERLDIYPQAIYEGALAGPDGNAITFSVTTRSPRPRAADMLPVIRQINASTGEPIKGVEPLVPDTSNPYRITVRIPLSFWDNHPDTTVELS